MRFFRLFLAGLIALAVMVMGFFVAAFVVLAGLFAATVQGIRRAFGRPVGPPPPPRPSTGAARPGSPAAGGDVIDVEATKVETKRELP